MRTVFGTLLLCLFFSGAYGQLELTTVYAVDKDYADGAPLYIAYDFRIKNRLFTKSQIGFKYLHHFNDFVGATMEVRIWEFHQTLSYEVIKKKKYIFKPNFGINYRFYKWKGEMVPPLNTLPGWAWVIDIREEDHFILESTTEGSYREYAPNNWGFSIQLQNQFRVNDKIRLHVTPFLEPYYDREQNTGGGCHIGVILKQLQF
jgi:hypothetical protein